VGKVAPAAAKALPEGIPTPGLPQKAKQAVEAIKAATPEAPKLPSGIPIPGLPSKVRVCHLMLMLRVRSLLAVRNCSLESSSIAGS